MRLVVLAAMCLWVGVTLMLSRVRWFARLPLADRIRPYAPGGFDRPSRRGLLSFASFAEVGAPLATHIGERLSRLFGVSEDLAVRLRRVHSPVDVTSFRLRQLAWAVGAFGFGAVGSIALRLPPAVGLLFVLGAPVLAFLILEQQVSAAAADWQRRVFLELPVVSEQIGMLLSAGYSLGSALNRTSQRSHGRCGQDLARVCQRVRQGLTEAQALREWSELADVDALDRLVQVLALNQEAGDLGRLISTEARSIRQDVQRDQVERIERRAQQVWIPVTVATLLPGVIFLAVPFLEAMRLFSSQ